MAVRNLGQDSKKRIVVGLSGGVDSSLALVLLKKAGWKPIAIFLDIPAWNLRSNSHLDLARRVSKTLNVPFFVLKVGREFRGKVVNYFLSEEKRGRTPNPCLICNRYVKIKALMDWAQKHKINYIATGHYAKVAQDKKTGEFELLRPKDKTKDQTYFLSLLPSKWLRHIIFPLGDYTKNQIYQLAKDNKLKFLLKVKPSQDFCFASQNNLRDFLALRLGIRKGNIVNTKGEIIGHHSGLYFYTRGQRKNIGLSGGPYFVKSLDKKNNRLIVTKKERELYSKEAIISPYHFISRIKGYQGIRIKAKIRYQSPLIKANLSFISGNRLKVEFDKPQRAITPGQFCVFYKNNICLGGGRIIKY